MTENDSLQQIVARNVRNYRRAGGMTLDSVAAAAGVSRRMLIMIEQGATNPSIATLDRLGQALGVGFAGLVGLPPPSGEAQTITPETMPIVWRGVSPESTARLTGALGERGAAELWEWKLAPGEVFAAKHEPPGTQKLLYILVGTLTLRIGDHTMRVPTGHGARLPADRPHGYENHDTEPLHFVGSVIFWPLMQEYPNVSRAFHTSECSDTA